jgi:LmbE family N-acetylglucosaminyl deacetylase
VRGIVVVAPHPDDDAIGCGGTIARCVSLGIDVNVVYVTDGAASHPSSKRFPGPALRALREREAVAGLGLLGVRRAPTFLRVPDGQVSALASPFREPVVAALARAFDTPGCAAVFAPWPGEPHPDHAASAELAVEALRQLGRRPALLWYAVWLDILGGSSFRPPPGAPFLDVMLSESERLQKRAAVMAHVSQTSRLIDDDPDGFCAAPEVLERWLQPTERFYTRTRTDSERVSAALHLGTSAP